MTYEGNHSSKKSNRIALFVILAFVTLLTVILIINILKNTGMVPYVPIVSVDSVLTDTPKLLTPDHLDAVDHVLSYYGQKHEFCGEKLYIEASLANDRDLLWNFTTKAEDCRFDKISGVKKWSFEDGYVVPVR